MDKRNCIGRSLVLMLVDVMSSKDLPIQNSFMHFIERTLLRSHLLKNELINGYNHVLFLKYSKGQ